MPSRPMKRGSLGGVFSAPGSVGINGSAGSDALQAGLRKIDRMIAASRLHYPAASENLRHWRNGSGRDRILPAGAFQVAPFLLQHLRDSHRPKVTASTRRRLISGELVPGQSGIDVECSDSVSPPAFTELYFALEEFTVRSKVRVAVVSTGGAARRAARPVGGRDRRPVRLGSEPMGALPRRRPRDERGARALQIAGFGRGYHVRSERAAITDPEVVAPVTLPPGNY